MYGCHGGDDIWQHVGRHGAGPVAESLHLDPLTPGRERGRDTGNGTRF